MLSKLYVTPLLGIVFITSVLGLLDTGVQVSICNLQKSFPNNQQHNDWNIKPNK